MTSWWGQQSFERVGFGMLVKRAHYLIVHSVILWYFLPPFFLSHIFIMFLLPCARHVGLGTEETMKKTNVVPALWELVCDLIPVSPRIPIAGPGTGWTPAYLTGALGRNYRQLSGGAGYRSGHTLTAVTSEFLHGMHKDLMYPTKGFLFQLLNHYLETFSLAAFSYWKKPFHLLEHYLKKGFLSVGHSS